MCESFSSSFFNKKSLEINFNELDTVSSQKTTDGWKKVCYLSSDEGKRYSVTYGNNEGNSYLSISQGYNEIFYYDFTREDSVEDVMGSETRGLIPFNVSNEEGENLRVFWEKLGEENNLVFEIDNGYPQKTNRVTCKSKFTYEKSNPMSDLKKYWKGGVSS